MTSLTPNIEEHELPCIEAVLAGTLALMTGYSQALQAELHPQQRLRMGMKIGENLAMLMDHPMLSLGFRQVICGLRGRWQAMSECTAQAAQDCGSGASVASSVVGAVVGTSLGRSAADRLLAPAPKRLQ